MGAGPTAKEVRGKREGMRTVEEKAERDRLRHRHGELEAEQPAGDHQLVAMGRQDRPDHRGLDAARPVPLVGVLEPMPEPQESGVASDCRHQSASDERGH